jgi:hypothetical protein
MEAHHLKTRRKDKSDTEDVCQACHRQVHALFTNTELRDSRLGLDTVEGLLADPRMAKAVAFIKKQPPGAKVTTRQSNHAKRRR